MCNDPTMFDRLRTAWREAERADVMAKWDPVNEVMVPDPDEAWGTFSIVQDEAAAQGVYLCSAGESYTDFDGTHAWASCSEQAFETRTEVEGPFPGEELHLCTQHAAQFDAELQRQGVTS